MSDFSVLASLFSYQFFQFAVLGGILAGSACAMVGVFIVLKKQSMLGDGLAHASFGGIAIGLFLGLLPLLTALLVSILTVLAISYMRRHGIAPSDASIAVFLALGFATGLVLISLSGGFSVDLFSYLFGSILTINAMDLMVIGLLGLTIIIFMLVFYKEIVALCFDENFAKLSGIPVTTFNLVFDVLVAITIVISIKIVGVILVSALVVIPALSALQLNLSFRRTMVASVAIAIVSVITGIITSALVGVATSGMIVFIAGAIFVICAIYKKLG
ncbi:MAG: metal ABC transporter permease [Thermoplasmata archaeon]